MKVVSTQSQHTRRQSVSFCCVARKVCVSECKEVKELIYGIISKVCRNALLQRTNVHCCCCASCCKTRTTIIAAAAKLKLDRHGTMVWSRVAEAVSVLVAVQRLGFCSGKRGQVTVDS